MKRIAAACLSCARRGERGFTLVEMIVVLLLLAVVLTMVFPDLAGRFGRSSADNALHRLTAALTEARAEAIATRRSVRFSLGEDRRSWRYAGFRGGLDGGELSLAGAPLPGGPAIFFFADGGSTGGSVTITDGAVRRRVTVGWLAGRIVETAE